MNKVINLVEIQETQKKFLKFLEDKTDMTYTKNNFEVTKQQALCMLSELYELENETKCHKWWDKQEIKRNKVLKELADLLSHIANTANQLDVQLILEDYLVGKKHLEGQILSLTRHMYELSYLKNTFYTRQKIRTIFKEYIELLYSLGFTIEQLESEYYNELDYNYKKFRREI